MIIFFPEKGKGIKEREEISLQWGAAASCR